MFLKFALSITAACGFAGAVWWLSPGAPTPIASPAATLAPRVDAPPALEYRGVAIQITDGRRPLATYGPLLNEIANLGANTVLLSVAARMEHARAQAIFIDARETPSAVDFAELIRRAKQQKLRVIVMPIVLLKHPRGSEWRGRIEPPDWTEWWRDYRDVIEYFADIARSGGADAFMIGSELVSTEKSTAEWVKVIAGVRKRFPGQLGYSANWDHYKPIQFWDKLDFVGMTSYYTLAKSKQPTVEQIVESWKPIREDITGWIRHIGKPLVLTEVGWCSQEGAASAPWNYYQNQKATPAGHEEQRRLYEGFVRAWDGAPGLAGVIWWEWTPAPGGAGDYGYSPKGKPAEALLRAWFERWRTTPPAASQATNGAESGGA